MNLTRCKVNDLLLAGGLVAPLFFAVVILAAAGQYAGYTHLTRAISELAATDAPVPWIQTTNFIVTGGLLALFGFGLFRTSGRWWGGLLIAVFGAAIVIQGMAPCDVGCNFVTTTGTVHNLTGLAGFVVAIVAVWLHGQRAADGPYRRYSRASAAVALTGFVLWIAVAKIAAIPAANGSLQRLFVGALLLWCAVTAARKLRWDAC